MSDIVAETLDAAALACDPCDGPPLFAVLMAHDGLSQEEVAKLWDELAWRLLRLHRLAEGLDDWSVWYDQADLPAAPSLQEAAIELATAEAAEARRAFLEGCGI